MLSVFARCHQGEPIVFMEPASLNFAIDSTVTVQCKATAYPAPTFTWRRNGDPVDVSERIAFNETTGVLTIKSATLEDAGEWDCIGTNQLGVGEASVTLNYIGKRWL